MTINNVKFKAADPIPPEPEQQPQAPTGPSTDEVLAMKLKLEEALAQLDKANEYDQYLPMGDKAQLEKSKALLMADIQVIDYYLKTGEWIGATLPATAAGAGSQYIDITELEAGFYVSNPDDQTAAPVKLEPTDDGKLNPENNGGTTVLTFVLGSSGDKSKDMIDATIKSVGQDAVIEVTFADGKTKKYTIVNGSTRPDLQIQLNGTNATHAIDIDASMFINPNLINMEGNATNNRGGITIIGTKYDDYILGSAGEDIIMGLGGSDAIDGMGSADEVYGYASQGDINGDGLGDGLVDVYGEDAETILGTDGGDTLYDMFGVKLGTEDYLNGGGGLDNVVRGKTLGALPEAPFTEDSSELASGPAKIDNWLKDSKGWKHEAKAGELLVTKDGDNPGTIDIDIPDGYMASAVKDGTDLVFNVVKPGKKGEDPEYYRIRIKDYFNEDGVKLNITGSFVDMGSSAENELDVGANPVTLNGTGKDGDILIGPKTVFEKYAMNVEDIGVSTKTDDELEIQLATFNEAVDPVWANAEVKDGSIIIDENNKAFIEDIKDGKFDIPTELGAVAFVKKTDYGYEVTVASNVGLESTRTVIKVYTDNKDLKFTMNGFGGGVYDFSEYKNGVGVKISGGKGKDVLVGYEYGTEIKDKASNGNAVIEIGIIATEGIYDIENHPEAPSSSTDVQASIEKQIADADNLEELKTIQKTIDGLATSDDNASILMADELQTELITRYEELLVDLIGELEDLIGAYEPLALDKEKNKTAIGKKDKEITTKISEINAMLAGLKDKDPDNIAYNAQVVDFGDKKDDFDAAKK